MSVRGERTALRDLEALFRGGAADGLTDGQLLARFAARPRVGRSPEAEAAFSTLVARHAPMVRRVCRHVLADEHDADDATQATFLVLARRARDVRRRDSVAPWLFGVALRVSNQARREAARRRRRESARVAELWSAAPVPDRTELWQALYEEVDRLPDALRDAVVRCDLAGASHAEAAARLGWPVKTLEGRLYRARDLLRTRLTRRGLAPAVALIPPAAIDLAHPRPGPLVWPVDAASSHARSLAKGAIATMRIERAKLVATAAAGLALLTAGAWSIAARGVPVIAPAQGPTGLAEKRIADPPGALPPREDLRRWLRLAATEAGEVARAKPSPRSSALTSIANAQAKAGDLDGARSSFALAAREAAGDLGGVGDVFGLAIVGQAQARSGLKAEARATLTRCSELDPPVTGDFSKDNMSVMAFTHVVRAWSEAGDRENARAAAEGLAAFADRCIKSSREGSTLPMMAPDVAGAFAAADDFEAAFLWSERIGSRTRLVGGRANVLGAIARSAAESLDRESAARFVREAADRMAKLEATESRYFGAISLAEAEARVGDVEAARRTARSIGDRQPQADHDVSDGQTYALLLVAMIQRQTGDRDGPRETLREAVRVMDDHPRMVGRVGRYSQVAAGQIANGDIDDALRTAEGMKGYETEVWLSAARAQAASGQPEAARATLGRIFKSWNLSSEGPAGPGSSPANPPGAEKKFTLGELGQIAEFRATAGDLAGALKTLRSIDEPSSERHALGLVASALASAGDLPAALRMAMEEAKTPEERASVLEGLGSGIDGRLTLEALRTGGK